MRVNFRRLLIFSVQVYFILNADKIMPHFCFPPSVNPGKLV